MAYAIQYTRSLFFLIQMYLMMVVFGLLFCPLVSLNRKYSYLAVHVLCRWVRWTASWMVGLKSEVRGVIPDHEFIIAAKHQSFFDIILIVSETPRPKFIMKSDTKFNGELNDPIKNLNYYFNLFITKVNFFYVKYFYTIKI